MAIGVYSDFKIYDEYFQTGEWEKSTQNMNAFNQASSGAMILTSKELDGHYDYNAFFTEIDSLVTRRDISSTSAATVLKMEQNDVIGVKLNRKQGPVAMTVDAFNKISRRAGGDVRIMSRLIGEMFAEKKLLDMVNAAILSVDTSIEAAGATALTYTDTTSTLTHNLLNNGNAKMGDKSGSIICYIMHSKAYHDLVGQAMTDKITDVANVAIREGNTFTLGRNVVVTDDASLVTADGVSSGVNSYTTIGLVSNGVVVEESERPIIANELKTGAENIYQQIQGEFAYNMKCKGSQWDVSNGGLNPTNTSLGTTTNWDQVATSTKNMAGVRIVTA